MPSAGATATAALRVALALLFFSASIHIQAAPPVPLQDPIPAKIEKGDIRVGVVDFVRAPRTQDTSDVATNAAHARIQYMLPVSTGSRRLAVNDIRGLLYMTDVHAAPLSTYLDLREQNVGFDDSMFPNEAGLLGFAFHPDFMQPDGWGYGRLYTAYSATDEARPADYAADDAASHYSVIREWTTQDPTAAVFAGSSREIFRIGQFSPNHNIATLMFDPSARPGTPEYGLLFAGFGDGGAANDPREYGQSLAIPHSSIIRIDPRPGAGKTYQVPSDNPFVADPAAAPEIWLYGLRHPQHFSFDAGGRLFIADIGQNQIEEINLGVRGANYGWRLREGTFATAFAVPEGTPGEVYAAPQPVGTPFLDPIAQYDHDEGRAVASGFIYEGKAIDALRGKYVFTELVNGRVFYIDAPQDQAEQTTPALIQELRLMFERKERDLVDVTQMPNTYAPGPRVDLRLGKDAAGELYLLTKSDGWIRKLVPAR